MPKPSPAPPLVEGVHDDQPPRPAPGPPPGPHPRCPGHLPHQHRAPGPEKSLGDQEALLRRFVKENYDGPVHWRIIAGRGSGEYLDRKELAQAEELIESRAIDLVVAEDLARLCRRV